MKKWIIVTVIAAAAIGGGSLYATGKLAVPEKAAAWFEKKQAERRAEVPPPAVSVARAAQADFVETVLVTGSLVAREDIIVAPEVSGQRVLGLLADIGDRVEKGQVLARLVTDNLDAQLAQNAASSARAIAAKAQAESSIAQARARKTETDAALARAIKLKKSGILAVSVYDLRLAAARTATARLTSAEFGLRIAEAEIERAHAQRRELIWRRGRAEVRAPASGIVVRRNGQVGAVASTGAVFQIAKDGEIELAGELSAVQLAKVRAGQQATLNVAGHGAVTGTVRLISPEVDKTTRLGNVRIFLGRNEKLRIGSFARGSIETAKRSGLALPAGSVMYDSDGAFVLAIESQIVRARRIKVGLSSGDRVEVTGGIAAGDMVVAKAGTFLRDGDAVRPVVASQARLSEAN